MSSLATSAQPAAMGPIRSSDRIGSLDVLRGFALLGILVMNIQSFSMPVAAYTNPTAYGSLEGANYWVWYASHLLFDTKFMGIFSMLFGASTLLVIGRVQKAGGSPLRIHFRRNFVLLLFGLLHAHGIWYGDILFQYAVSSFFIVWFRRRSATALLAVGFVVLAIGSGVLVGLGLSFPHWSTEAQEDLYADTNPSAEEMQAEITAYRGSWLDQQPHRSEMAVELETFVYAIFLFWRSAGMMLIGMALYRWGVFQAQRSDRFYVALIIVAIAVGLPVVHLGVVSAEANEWDGAKSFFDIQYNYWGGILVSLGWVGAIQLAYRYRFLPALQRALSAVGRTALTNYLFQSVISTFVFYGSGLGLFGQVDRTGQALIVVAIWTVQLIASSLWVRAFRFGPVEWLWRTLTYMRPQPMRR